LRNHNKHHEQTNEANPQTRQITTAPSEGKDRTTSESISLLLLNNNTQLIMCHTAEITSTNLIFIYKNKKMVDYIRLSEQDNSSKLADIHVFD